jgi:hypothetical protein
MHGATHPLTHVMAWFLIKHGIYLHDMGPKHRNKFTLTPHCYKPACYEMLHRALDLDRFFGMTLHKSQCLNCEKMFTFYLKVLILEFPNNMQVQTDRSILKFYFKATIHF